MSAPARTRRTVRLYRLGHNVPRASDLPRRSRRMLARHQGKAMARWVKRVPHALRARRARLVALPVNQRRGRVWSAEVARLVAAGLHACGNLRAVARELGIQSGTFYLHRKADPVFAYHWEKALTDRYQEIEDLLIERALNGWSEEVWHQGECKGTRTCWDAKLCLDLLKLKLQRDRFDSINRRADARDAREDMLFEVETRALTAVHAGEPDAVGGDAIPANHQLFLDLMERHRNRHPDEWDEDIHTASGFDFNDWRAWVARWEASNADRIAEERAHTAALWGGDRAGAGDAAALGVSA